MRVFWANFRLVVGRLGVFLLGLILILVVYVIGWDEGDRWLWFFLVPGVGVSDVWFDLTGKPLSFCLPGYRRSLHYLILAHAVLGAVPVAGLGASLAIERSAVCMALWALCGFALGFTAILALSLLRLVHHVSVPSPKALKPIRHAVVFVFVLVAVLAWLWFLCPSVGRPLLLPACLGVCVLLWTLLSDAETMGHAHRVQIAGFNGPLNRIDEVSDSASLVAAFLFGKIKCSTPLGVSRCIWGNLYAQFSPFRWLPLGIFLFVMTIVLGFFGVMAMQYGLLAMGMFAAVIVLPTRSDVLLPEGRREKFYSSVVLALTTVGLVLGAALLLAGLSWLFARGVSFLPPKYRYVAIDPRDIWFSVLLIPWLFCFTLVGQRRSVLMGIITVAGATLPITAIILLHYALCDEPHRLARILLITVFLSGWAFFLAILGYTCAKGALVGPRMRDGAKP